MAAEGWRAFRARVDADVELAARLAGVPASAFEDEVIRAAAELGYDVTAADVRSAMAAARGDWEARWMP